MKRISRLFLLAILAWIAVPQAARAETRVSVRDGKVLAQSAEGQVEAAAGQQAVLEPEKKPLATVDEPIINVILDIDSWVTEEKKQGPFPFIGYNIQAHMVESEQLLKSYILVDTPAGRLQPKSAGHPNGQMRFGRTTLARSAAMYDMEGRLLPFNVEKASETEGFYYIDPLQPLASGEDFKFIMVQEFEYSPGIPKDGPLWIIPGANDSANFLNYFCIVLPKGATFLRCTPDAVAMPIVDGRQAIIMRNETGPEANGRWRVICLGPDQNGGLKALPTQWRRSEPTSEMTDNVRGDVLKSFESYQQACREKNYDQVMGLSDLDLWAKMAGKTMAEFQASHRKDLEAKPQFLDLIAQVKVEAVEPYTGNRFMYFEPVWRVRGGGWQWYFRKAEGQWKLISQDLDYNPEQLNNFIDEETKSHPGAAVQLPSVTPTEADAAEARQAFEAYQKICAAHDIEAYVKLVDSCFGLDTNKLREQLKQVSPQFLDKIASAKIASAEIGLKYDRSNPHAPNPVDGTVLLLRSDRDWGWYLHKTANGWKILSQENIGR